MRNVYVVGAHTLRFTKYLDDSIKDLTARLVYERAIPLLEEKQRTRGRLVFLKPDRLAMELGKPRNEDVYTDGETWWIVSHNDRQVEVYQASEQTTREAAFLRFGYGEGSEDLLEDYRVELTERTREEDDEGAFTRYRLRFLPRQKKGQQRPPRYSEIEVELTDRRWLPHRLVLHESEILHTYELSRIELNTDVDGKLFDYKPPRGYAVQRPQQSG